MHEVAHLIDKVVDFEESSRKTKFSVRSGIDRSLDTSMSLAHFFLAVFFNNFVRATAVFSSA